jgi:hypothetical protein
MVRLLLLPVSSTTEPPQPKKPFINKKEATTFHLIHQSVRDEGTDNPCVRTLELHS